MKPDTPKPTLVILAGVDPTLRTGGGERYVCSVARAAGRAGFVPHIFCLGTHSGVEDCDLGTVHRVWSPVRPFRNLLAPLHARFLIHAINRFLGERDGRSIIHAFSTWANAAARVSAAQRRKGRQCVSMASTWDGTFEESRAKLAAVDPSQGWRGRLNPALEVLWSRAVGRRQEEIGYRRSETVHVNYHSVQRLLVSRYCVDPAKIDLVPYAAETAFLSLQQQLPPQTIVELRAAHVPLIVVVSRHVPRKGLPVLLRALAALHAEGVAFRACLTGRGYLIDHHRQLAGDLGLDSVVRIVGHVPESFEYLRHADLFVLPSLEEGSGSLSLLEALQAGVPVIASRIDGIPEDVTDEVDGLLVEPGNVPALANAIGRLLNDPALRQRLGQRGLETFRKRFSAEAMTRSLAETYERLQSGR